MKICRIRANNFRTLENFDLNLRPNYCAISGKNNAGKSAIVKIIQYFLDDRDEYRYVSPTARGITFTKDCTQWTREEHVTLEIEVEIHRENDSEVFFVVETFCSHEIVNDLISVRVEQVFPKTGASSLSCTVDGEVLDGQKASEILKKLRAASNLVVHNSTRQSHRLFYTGEDVMEVSEVSFSDEDQKKISDAEKNLQSRIKKAAKQHKDELEKLLGKLNDKYQVELSTLDLGRSARVPLEIKLTDRSVEVPLTDWGAGTQNRTRVLMSVLDAVRIRSKVTAQDRSTPVFLVEEPESFLHPSAQAEFGQVLNGLAEELQIQIIATTHSPYMLNQSDPSANILLERRVYRGITKETYIKDTAKGDWMLPFAENLGIIPSEFDSWKPIFAAHGSKAILVEGEIDKEYFELIREKYPSVYQIDNGIEILPYGGKDALKNTSILQFMIKKFGKVYFTFDLDARSELKSALERIGLSEQDDFCAIGVDGPGKDCIEGLLPQSLKQKVYSSNVDLVTALTSQDSKARTSAKYGLKKEMLAEFRRSIPVEKDLGEFKKLFATIKSSFK